MSNLLASTQNRDVAVTVAGRSLGIADTHEPGEIQGNATAHFPGGSKRWRVLDAKTSIADGTLEWTLDPELDFWVIGHLERASDAKAEIVIVDVYRIPGSNRSESKTYRGRVNGFQAPSSDSKDASAQTYTVTYIPTEMPS